MISQLKGHSYSTHCCVQKWSDIAIIDVILAAFVAVDVVGVVDYLIADVVVACCCF